MSFVENLTAETMMTTATTTMSTMMATAFAAASAAAATTTIPTATTNNLTNYILNQMVNRTDPFQFAKPSTNGFIHHSSYQQPPQSSSGSYGRSYGGGSNIPNQYSQYGMGMGQPMWPSSGMGPEESWNSWNRVFKLVVLSFVSTIGSMGSIFIISAITVIETFQVRGNCYLVSLAFGHLLVTILVLPASAIAIMADVTDDPDICHFQWILTISCMIVSILSFFFMAIDNYCGMNSLIRYHRCCTRFRIFIFILFSWVAAFTIPIVQHVQSWGPEFCADKRQWNISLDYHPYLIGSIAIITALTFIYFIRTLFKHKTYKLQLESSSSSSAAAKDANHFVLSDGYLLQSNVVVYLLSLLMWIPLTVTMVIDPINPIPQHYLNTVWYIALGNSCCYSYMYAATNRDFREAFNKLFYYCCCKSHVTFTRKGQTMRRTVANESMGLRVHIIPGLNIYAQRKDATQSYGHGGHGGGGGGMFGGHGGGGSSHGTRHGYPGHGTGFGGHSGAYFHKSTTHKSCEL